MNLSGKVVLITGGARMGASLAHACAARGAGVALSYSRSAAAIGEMVASIIDAGGRAAGFRADLRSPPACESLIADVIAWAGQLDVLICLASVYERVPLDSLTVQQWHDHLAVDLDASFHCARAAAAHMRPRGAGHVIFCSDWVAASGQASVAHAMRAYCDTGPDCEFAVMLGDNIYPDGATAGADGRVGHRARSYTRVGVDAMGRIVGPRRLFYKNVSPSG